MTHLAIAGGAYMLLLALVIVSNHGAHKIQAGGIVLALSRQTRWWPTL